MYKFRSILDMHEYKISKIVYIEAFIGIIMILIGVMAAIAEKIWGYALIVVAISLILMAYIKFALDRGEEYYAKYNGTKK